MCSYFINYGRPELSGGGFAFDATTLGIGSGGGCDVACCFTTTVATVMAVDDSIAMCPAVASGIKVC